MHLWQRIKNVFRSIKNSFKRFPVTIGVSTTLVIMLIILLERRPYLTSHSRDVFGRINMIIALGIPLSLCIKLIYEKKDNWGKVHEVLGYILGAGVLFLYYFFLLKDFKMVSMIRYIGVTLFLYLAFSYIPWISRKEDFELYIIKVFSSFFLTIIYSFVLYLGISAILFTIDQLFNANIPGKYYYYMFLIVAGVFAPSLFLSRIPEADEKFDKYIYSKSLKVLLLYIVIPLITIYSTILYVYFFKIIITKDWPQGLVSHLVLWYSTFSIAVIFFITPIINQNKWAYRFKNWFPKLIIPILVMMFISIGIRIRSYGITENRYFVLVLGLWVLGIMLYFALIKKSNNIIIPITLSIIALNSVFGPLSSFAVSKRSQNKRFQSILLRNNMLEDNKIIKATEAMPTDEKMEISEILKYFETKHSLKEVKYIPKDFETRDMERVFGFPYIEKSIYKNDYFNYFSQQQGKVIGIKGYDYFLEGYAISNRVELNEDIVVFYDWDNFDFKIEQKGSLIYETNLKNYGLDILEKNKELNIENSKSLSIDEMTVTDENDKVKLKLIFNNLSGERYEQSNNPVFRNIDYYVLIKIK